ncbi:MAG: hypothetical protein ACC628_11065 [Pirellulaceae bacterium]
MVAKSDFGTKSTLGTVEKGEAALFRGNVMGKNRSVIEKELRPLFPVSGDGVKSYILGYS